MFLPIDGIRQNGSAYQGPANVPQTLFPFFSKNGGLALWLRADLGVTIATGVSVWADQSGWADANRNAVQATGTKQPTRNLTDAAYNNQTTLSFSAAALQFLATGIWSVALAQPFTLIVVGNDDGTAVEQLYCDTQTGATPEAAILNLGDTHYYASNGATTVPSTAPLVSNSKRILAAEFNGASSNLYNNALTPVGTGNLGATNLPGMTIGASKTPGLYLNGKIAEVIAFNRLLLASEKQALISGYLSPRYAITVGA